MSLSADGPLEALLDPEPPAAVESLAALAALSAGERREAAAAVVAGWPRCLAAWAALGDAADDVVESYAAYRVGYHRGLDRLRQSGWRGSGYVRWRHPENRGFLACLEGLARTAGMLGEVDEHDRCTLFLRQLDPDWPPAGG